MDLSRNFRPNRREQARGHRVGENHMEVINGSCGYGNCGFDGEVFHCKIHNVMRCGKHWSLHKGAMHAARRG